MSAGPLAVPAPVPPPAPPPARTELAPGEVHVWQAPLAGTADESLLSEEELLRAGRAATASGRERFVRTRSVLRRVLAGYAGADPAALRFGEGPEGKPFLRRPGGGPTFNLSHAGSLLVLAVARGQDVGIDVERVDRKVDMEGVAQRLFAPSERAFLARLEGEAKTRAFFRCWSTREAVVKGLGRGMLTPDVELEVEADPGRPLAVRVGGGAPWWVAPLPVPEGFFGVLAVEGEPELLRSFELGP